MDVDEEVKEETGGIGEGAIAATSQIFELAAMC